MSFEVGQTVAIGDRVGAIVGPDGEGWVVRLSVETPHPHRANRLIASSEDVFFPAGEVREWTEEDEARHQAELRDAQALEWKRLEAARLERVSADMALEELVGKYRTVT